MRRIAVGALALGVLSVLPVAQADEPCVARLLVLSAFPGEMDPLLARASIDATEVADGRSFYVGELAGNDVVLALTGIGLVNATATVEAALTRFGCEAGRGIGGIVFSGVSGGRSSIGDVAVPARWTVDDGETWFAADQAMLEAAAAVASEVELSSQVPLGDVACVGVDPSLVRTVTLAHAPRIIVGGDGRSSDPFDGRALPCFPGGGDVFGCEPCRAPEHHPPDPQRTATQIVPFLDPAFFFGYFASPPDLRGYDAEDMETAAVAQIAVAHDIPFVAFRALSDGNGDPLMLPGFPFQFFFYRQLAADNAAAHALAFLEAWSAR